MQGMTYLALPALPDKIPKGTSLAPFGNGWYHRLMISPRRKKNINSSNPRRSPRKSEKPGLDRVTVVLSIVAGILLVLVILFLDRRTVGRLFPGIGSGITGNNGSPVIQRVEIENALSSDAEPVIELGEPDQSSRPPQETVPAETTEEDIPGDSKARLFFVKVSDEGKISIKSVLRPVPDSSSPLTMSIKTLLDGPRPTELSNDVLSLIPDGSQLIGARIEGGIAFLDFNEQFRFNALGIEGYKSQVEQIVYTATEFSTVVKVQILIEGQRIEYLGGEGFWVGGPLGREDF